MYDEGKFQTVNSMTFVMVNSKYKLHNYFSWCEEEDGLEVSGNNVVNVVYTSISMTIILSMIKCAVLIIFN